MATLKKYNLNGAEVGEIAVDEAFLDAKANPQMVKDYIVAIRANARQWSASTKGRSEVKHTTKKPHRQKGTGNARQGSLVTSQYRGGGIVFGPKPKFDQHVRINQKERKAAIRFLLAEKIKSARVFVVEDAAFSETLKEPKTKVVSSFLRTHKLLGRPVLFVGEGEYEEFENIDGRKVRISVFSPKHDVIKLSVRNIPRSEFSVAANVNGYELLTAHHLVLTETAFAQLQELLK